MTIVRGRDGIGRRGGRPRKYSEARIALAKSARGAGIPVRVIAHYLDAPVETVRTWCTSPRYENVAPNPAFAQGLERLFGE